MKIEELESFLNIAIDVKTESFEKNIFSIGGRGHYENPISDILCFFLDPNESHGFGQEVLNCLCQAAAIEVDLSDVEIKREVGAYGNFIDIVLVSGNHVVVIENKIRGQANNPFASYEKFIDTEYKNSTHHYIVLSPKGDKGPGSWKRVSYTSIVDRVEKSFRLDSGIRSFNSKWYILLREFMINIKQECGAVMQDYDFKFVSEKYNSFLHARKVFDQFMIEVGNRLDSKCKIEDWRNEGVAMTITPLKKEKEFGPNKVIVLLRPNNGKYRVQFNIAKDNLNGFECACRSGNGINRKEYDPIPEKTVNGAESNCYIRKDEFDFLENALDEVRVILYGRPSSRIS